MTVLTAISPDSSPLTRWLRRAALVTASARPVIGLALGGGAARGFAHIGVLQVLQENGIKPDLVAGTSAGSLVAALYASGMDARKLEQVALKMDESALTDWSFPLRGLLRGDALGDFVRKETGGLTIQDMRVPLGIVATNVRTGDPILFRRGDTATAVRASSAVPAIFSPVTISGQEYVDGGLTSPVPVQFAQKMGATFVIAVDISSPPNPDTRTDPFSLLLQTTSIMTKSINRWELAAADVTLRPAIDTLSSVDFGARAQAIAAGRKAALAALPTLRAKLAAAGWR
ncbi:patatin-like phospholipase family protein [Amphibiibacter pelophylacis]|uniref:Patatin-like phospholipase family protein n=1 Tax=Amphibiibacter pelophylacis TaxID=1799477 RepID=A0ACC6NZX0_9BURK